MEKFWTVYFAILILLHTMCGVRCHGRLWDPPSRSSMWRLGYNTSVNINDNELNCGGFQNQWISYGGLCGTCGDPFQQRPRENEAGGKYASGLITRLYKTGEVIPITIDLTANHGGYFEFRLCPVDNRDVRATSECFDQYPLVIVNQLQPGIKYWIQDRGIQGHMNLEVKLPPLMSCKHCVLQWRWWTASRWGCEGDLCGKGQGPQEEFYGCSDIAIAPPNQYTSYLPLITPPTESSPVAYGAPTTNHNHADQYNAQMQLEVRELHTSDIVEQPLRSKLVGPSYAASIVEQPLRSNFVGPTSQRPNNLPEAKVFFTTKRLHDRPVARNNLNNALQRIMIDTYRKYDQPSLKKVNALGADRECLPTARFSDNPIILEWCMRGCPGFNKDCPPNMCFCKPTFKQNNEVLIPFMDLALYKSELRNKVPFELTNSFLGFKMQDGFVGNSLNDIHFQRKLGINNENLIRKSLPKHIENVHRLRNHKSDIWNIWNNRPYNKQVETRIEPIEFPIKTRPVSPIYKQPVRTSLPKRRGIPPPKRISRTKVPQRRRLPLETIHTFVPKAPNANGLTLFSKPRRIKGPPLFKKTIIVDKYITSPTVRKEIVPAQKVVPAPVQRKVRVVPFKLTSKRDFLPHESIEVMPRKIRCAPSTVFGHVDSMIKWCQKNCSFGFCPPSVCKCF